MRCASWANGTKCTRFDGFQTFRASVRLEINCSEPWASSLSSSADDLANQCGSSDILTIFHRVMSTAFQAHWSGLKPTPKYSKMYKKCI